MAKSKKSGKNTSKRGVIEYTQDDLNFIQKGAYTIWEVKGRRQDTALDDWLESEQKFLKKASKEKKQVLADAPESRKLIKEKGAAKEYKDVTYPEHDEIVRRKPSFRKRRVVRSSNPKTAKRVKDRKSKPVSEPKLKKSTKKSVPLKKYKVLLQRKQARKKISAKKLKPAKKTQKKRVARNRIPVKKRIAARAGKMKKTPRFRPEAKKTRQIKPHKLAIERIKPGVQKQRGVTAAFKETAGFAWIGVGQCGGRLVKSFYDRGYKKAIVVNTDRRELDMLKVPANQTVLMDVGLKGGSKDMARCREAGLQYQQEVLHLAKKTFGDSLNHIMVCFGAGGGAGGGAATAMIDAAKKYAQHIGKTNPEKHVGAFVVLPTAGEASSPLIAKNAFSIVSELGSMADKGKISPLVIVDNAKISSMYPDLTVDAFWPTINNTVAGLFDIFNRLSTMSTPYTPFDSGDYQSILQAGGCAVMGITSVNNYKDQYAISRAVKANLEKTLFAAGFDLSGAKVAAGIVVGGKKMMRTVKGLQDNINYAFDVLSEITGKATVHRGIYEDNREVLRVYTIIGGLALPKKRLAELKKSG